LTDHDLVVAFGVGSGGATSTLSVISIPQGPQITVGDGSTISIPMLQFSHNSV
jgi:hypothetical protein